MVSLPEMLNKALDLPGSETDSDLSLWVPGGEPNLKPTPWQAS